jgi:hypothetical protein
MLKRILQPGAHAGDACLVESCEGQAQRGATMLVRNGSALSVESTLLGDPGVPTDKRRDILVDANRLSGVQRALWETQRCLLPCRAVQSQEGSSLRQSCWHVPERPMVYVAGIRLVSRIAERMQPWCLLVCRPHLGTGPLLPLHLTDMTPRAWLELDGLTAWDHVQLNWQIADRKAAARELPSSR